MSPGHGTVLDNARFRCSVCQRPFSKKDHLARHLRSHNKERPFQCPGCGKCYSRRDVLLRHMRDAAHPRPLYPETYEELQQRADGSEVTTDHAHAGRPQRSILNQPQTPVAFPDVPALPSSVLTMRANNTITSTTNGDDSESSLVARYVTPHPTRLDEWEPGTSSTDVEWNWQLPCESIEPDQLYTEMSASMQTPYIWASWQEHTHSKTKSVSTGTLTTTAPPLPDMLDDESRTTLFDELKTFLTIGATKPSLPSLQSLDICLDLYRQHVHPILPILHFPTYNRSRCSPMLMLAMFAAGSTFSGSAKMKEQGVRIFYQLIQVIHANWDHHISSDHAPVSLQSAVISQFYGLMSGRNDILERVDALRGTLIAVAMRFRLFEARATDFTHLLRQDSDTDALWANWARNECKLRLSLSIYILDSELSRRLHNQPLIHFTMFVEHAIEDNHVFLAQTSEEWRTAYLNRHKPTPFHSGLPHASYMPESINPVSKLRQERNIFVAPAFLENIIMRILSVKKAPSVYNMTLQSLGVQLCSFQNESNCSLEKADLGQNHTALLWHGAWLYICADVELLDLVAQNGSASSEQNMKIEKWRMTKQALRGCLHSLFVQKQALAMKIGRECPIYTPFVIYNAGLIWHACSKDLKNSAFLSALYDTTQFEEFNHLSSEVPSLISSILNIIDQNLNVLSPLCDFISVLERLDHFHISRVLSSRLVALMEQNL